MMFKSKQHKFTFEEAIKNTNNSNNKLMAAIYLLSADQFIWKKVKDKVFDNYIKFDDVKLDTMRVKSYALYSASKDMYFSTDHITISDFFDTTLISQTLFNIIITAINIRRWGLEKADAIEGNA